MDDSRGKYCRLDTNQGKTAAFRAGFAATRGKAVIVQDADVEYDPTVTKFFERNIWVPVGKNIMLIGEKTQ